MSQVVLASALSNAPNTAIVVAQPTTFTMDFSFLPPQFRQEAMDQYEHRTKLSGVLHQIRTEPLLSLANTTTLGWVRTRAYYLQRLLKRLLEDTRNVADKMPLCEDAPEPARSWFQREYDEQYGPNRTDARAYLRLLHQLESNNKEDASIWLEWSWGIARSPHPVADASGGRWEHTEERRLQNPMEFRNWAEPPGITSVSVNDAYEPERMRRSEMCWANITPEMWSRLRKPVKAHTYRVSYDR